MSTLYGQLMTLYLFIFAGWLLGKAKKDAAEKSSVLSFVLVNLFLPAKVFLNFATNFTVSYVQTNYMTLFIATGILAVLVVLGHNVPKLLTKNSYERKVYNYSTSISNYAYFGYVLVEQVLGPAAMNNLMVFCIPFSIYCYTAGVAMLKNQKLSIKTLFNTVTVSLAAGIAVGLSGWTLPAVMQTVLKSAGSCMGPVSMVLVGLVLATFSFKDLLPSLGSLVFCVIRLGLAPLAVYGICKGLALVMPLPEAVYPSAVLMAAMPCGLNPVVFPKLVGQDCRPGAKLILLTSVVSLVTIPFWLQMLA